MSTDKKFGLLRKVLYAIGLSQDAADQVVDFIVDLLAGEGKGKSAASAVEFPYHLRDHFLSPAELYFHDVLRGVVADRAVINAKVALGDLFYVKKGDDASRYRIYTNKIDRKHVDFLLSDPATMRPLVGIELDDRSHERPDRQARDAFVDGVFGAAKLPLVHIPVRRSYVMAEIAAQIAPYLTDKPQTSVPTTTSARAAETIRPVKSAGEAPCCPKCGAPMILRTASKGANAGSKFWGCSNYPTCRSMLPLKA
jgi:hypothetical protein